MDAKNNPPPNTHRLVITREFDAPREMVWKAWTTPSQVAQWLELVENVAIKSVMMDLRVGGKFRIQTTMKDGEFFTASGTYLEVKPPERVVYTWDWEKDGSEADFGELEGAETQLTVEFHEIGKRTQLVMAHEKFTSEKRRDNHVVGWNMWLDEMEKFVGNEQRTIGEQP